MKIDINYQLYLWNYPENKILYYGHKYIVYRLLIEEGLRMIIYHTFEELNVQFMISTEKKISVQRFR